MASTATRSASPTRGWPAGRQRRPHPDHGALARQPGDRRRQQRPGHRSREQPCPDRRPAGSGFAGLQRHGGHRRLRARGRRRRRRGRRRLGQPDRRTPDRSRRPAPAAGGPEHRPPLAGHRRADRRLFGARDAHRRRRHDPGRRGIKYGPVTVTGSGTTYTITFARPIAKADRVTISIAAPALPPSPDGSMSCRATSTTTAWSTRRTSRASTPR